MDVTTHLTTPAGQTLDPLRFPLHGSRLIEASAGTGKTYTLALLYTRLVLGHGDRGEARDAALMPPNILVVTFTDAATQELRERIRARLVEAADLFSQTADDSGADARATDDPLRALRDSHRPAPAGSSARAVCASPRIGWTRP